MSRNIGKLFERALVGQLLQQGFHIPKHDPALDHDAKLDFVIHRFPGSLMHHQVGVQLTVGESDNVKKMQEFFEIHSGRYEKGVQRSIFLQADSEVDIDAAAFVIGTAITQFQFDRQYAQDRVIGIEVGEDSSYGLFSLKTRIAAAVEAQKPKPSVVAQANTSATAPVASASVQPKVASVVEGTLTYWIPEELGYGYVFAQDGETYYLHFNSVADDKLRSALTQVKHRSRYPLTESLEFEPGDKRSSLDKYKPARNARIATGKPLTR